MSYLPQRSQRCEPIRLGMVGGGNDAFIGEIQRIAARLEDRYRLVAGALSSTPERSRASGACLGLDPERTYENFAEMDRAESAREDGVEAVTVVTPNHLHAPASIAFLDHGIHVICDKPLTASLEQAEELAEVARSSQALFVLTHNYTGYPMIRQALEMVRSGELGTVRVVQVEYTTDWLATAKEESGLKQAVWRTDPTRAGAGGCVGDIGTHAFHLMRFVTGLSLRELSAEIHTFVPGRRVDDHVQAQLRFAYGAKGLLWASQVTVGEENGLRLRVYGDRGSLSWDQEEPNKLWHATLVQPKQLVTRMGPGARPVAIALSRTPKGLPEGYLEGFANLYSDAADMICASRDRVIEDLPPTLPGLEDGLEGMAFIDAVLRSSDQNGAWVSPLPL